MTIQNLHGVHKEKWRKWSPEAQAIFNGLYEDIERVGQCCFLHPNTVARNLSPDEFKTVAWNAAWLAADQVMQPGSITERVDTIEQAA